MMMSSRIGGYLAEKMGKQARMTGWTDRIPQHPGGLR